MFVVVHSIAGTLSSEWGGPETLPSLGTLEWSRAAYNEAKSDANASCNVLGSMSQTWQLSSHVCSVLFISSLPLTGTLPSSWGSNGSFPSLATLDLGSDSANINPFSGPLPPEWGSPTSFQKLTELSLANCSITGRKLDVWCSSWLHIESQVIIVSTVVTGRTHLHISLRIAYMCSKTCRASGCVHTRTMTLAKLDSRISV